MGFTSHRGFESRPLRSRPPTSDHQRVAAILGGAHAPVAQLDRASVYGTEGHRFESCRARSRIWLYEGKSGRLSNPLGWQQRRPQGNSDRVATRADLGSGGLSAWLAV